ncbi:MAG: helix-turn-helix transcriptional regulator [Clostridia bacterium]|nr:helix-turn-helix transcriptional regulator [Clostridia bacterium]
MDCQENIYRVKYIKKEGIRMVKLTIKEYLSARGISRYELSKRTEIGFQTIDRYYKNRVIRYDSYVLDRICEALDCNVCDILTFTKDSEK